MFKLLLLRVLFGIYFSRLVRTAGILDDALPHFGNTESHNCIIVITLVKTPLGTSLHYCSFLRVCTCCGLKETMLFLFVLVPPNVNWTLTLICASPEPKMWLDRGFCSNVMWGKKAGTSLQSSATTNKWIDGFFVCLSIILDGVTPLECWKIVFYFRRRQFVFSSSFDHTRIIKLLK